MKRLKLRPRDHGQYTPVVALGALLSQVTFRLPVELSCAPPAHILWPRMAYGTWGRALSYSFRHSCSGIPFYGVLAFEIFVIGLFSNPVFFLCFL